MDRGRDRRYIFKELNCYKTNLRFKSRYVSNALGAFLAGAVEGYLKT